MLNNWREYLIIIYPLLLSIAFCYQSRFESDVVFSRITFLLSIYPLATNCLLSFRELYQIPSLILVERFHLFIHCLFPFCTFYTLYCFFVGVGDSIINHRKCISHHVTIPSRFLDNPFWFTRCNGFLLCGCWSCCI